MKYIPLNNSPNVSDSRLESISPSLKLDARGFPHISYLSKGNNINDVNYSFWDGLKWSYYGIPKIANSNENIVSSPNSLVLDTYDFPIIVFANKIGSGFRLSLASYNSEWIFSTQDVNYNVGWIGVIRYDGSPDIDFSSSSSESSAGFSESSSSVDSLSTASSSSSSYSHTVYYVTVYDSTNSQFKIYLVDGGTWTLFGSKSAVVDGYGSLKIGLCGKRLAIVYIYDGSSIKYNFIDLNNSSWSFLIFQDISYSLLYGEVIDMGFSGHYKEDLSYIYIGWISRTSYKSYVNGVICYSDGSELPSDGTNVVIESQDIIVNTSADYIVNGYRKISVCLNDSYKPMMIAMGLKSKLFSLLTDTFWYGENVDIEGVSNGIVPLYLSTSFNNIGHKIAMATDSGNIYYFEVSANSTFPISTPNIVLLNNRWDFNTYYSNGRLSGVDIDGTYAVAAGDILVDAKSQLLLSVNAETPITTTTTTTGIITTTTTTPVSVRAYYASGFGDFNFNGCYLGPEPPPGALAGYIFYRNENTSYGDAYGYWIIRATPDGYWNPFWFMVYSKGSRYIHYGATPDGAWQYAGGSAPYGNVSIGCP